MTALTPGREAREQRRPALERASKIRFGMVNYLETLALVIAARAENDHLALGYKTWQEYLDKEFGAERLKIAPELQQKAIVELRLAGASQREIGATLGLNQSNVSRALTDRPSDANASPDEIYDRDGNLVPPAKSPLVAALTGAIEDAEKRNETAGLAGPAPDGEQAQAPSGTAAAGPRVGEPAAATQDQPEAVIDPGQAEAERVPAPTAAGAGLSGPEGEAGSSTATGEPAPNEERTCEKCGGPILAGQAAAGYTRCDPCDPEGDHVYAPLSIGDDGIECGECDAIAALLTPGRSLTEVLAEARDHITVCGP